MTSRRKKLANARPSQSQPRRKEVLPRTPNQKLYIDEIYDNDIIFCQGPAGSGKSHVAIGVAIKEVLAGHYEKMVISRPVVESGQKLGYLPGSAEDKLNPYLTPMFDEMRYYLSEQEIKAWKAAGTLEIAPTAFMRGRTFKNSFMIIDESQNSTYNELKMVATRLGIGSKIVFNGDVTQSDLPPRDRGGFAEMMDRLEGIEGIGTVRMGRSDIVRHPLIDRIIGILEEDEEFVEND